MRGRALKAFGTEYLLYKEHNHDTAAAIGEQQGWILGLSDLQYINSLSAALAQLLSSISRINN